MSTAQAPQALLVSACPTMPHGLRLVLAIALMNLVTAIMVEGQQG